MNKVNRILEGEDVRNVLEADSHEVAVKKINVANQKLEPMIKRLGIKYTKKTDLEDPTSMPEIRYEFKGKHDYRRVQDLAMGNDTDIGFKYIKGELKGSGYLLQFVLSGSKTILSLVYTY